MKIRYLVGLIRIATIAIFSEFAQITHVNEKICRELSRKINGQQV